MPAPSPATPEVTLNLIRLALARLHLEQAGHGNRSSAVWEFIEDLGRLLGQELGKYQPQRVLADCGNGPVDPEEFERLITGLMAGAEARYDGGQALVATHPSFEAIRAYGFNAGEALSRLRAKIEDQIKARVRFADGKAVQG